MRRNEISKMYLNEDCTNLPLPEFLVRSNSTEVQSKLSVVS